MSDGRSYTFLGELPASARPWTIVMMNGIPVFVNEDHPPMWVQDGKLVTFDRERPMTATEVLARDAIVRARVHALTTKPEASPER